MDPDPDLLEFAKFLAMLIVVFVLITDVKVWTTLTKPRERRRIFQQ